MRKTFIAIAAAAVLMPASGWAAPPFTTPLEPRSESGSRSKFPGKRGGLSVPR